MPVNNFTINAWQTGTAIGKKTGYSLCIMLPVKLFGMDQTSLVRQLWEKMGNPEFYFSDCEKQAAFTQVLAECMMNDKIPAK